MRADWPAARRSERVRVTVVTDNTTPIAVHTYSRQGRQPARAALIPGSATPAPQARASAAAPRPRAPLVAAAGARSAGSAPRRRRPAGSRHTAWVDAGGSIAQHGGTENPLNNPCRQLAQAPLVQRSPGPAGCGAERPPRPTAAAQAACTQRHTGVGACVSEAALREEVTWVRALP